jgi:predicted ATPase/DNA-binding XRE family transcriptional regulator
MEQHSFGFWLRLQRKALDLTREELAERVGYSAATIRKIEDEERHPSAQVVERLAEVFRIPQNERTDFLRFARGDWSSVPVDTEGDQPWRASGKSPRSNIPATTTSLIAREKEIALVREYLSREDIRLVTLMGPPGIGKTRLSIEAARASLHEFRDGVFFVALAPLEDPDLIASAITQALGFVGAKNISTLEQLKQGIADKHVLLVLDNCEHLIEAVALLASDLLSACSHLKILATSRESLRISGEWLYAVPAFDLPADRSSLELESASKYPALTLFAERARAVRSDFSLNADNLETIIAICARLDGLPLVIELIAARMRLMSPQALLDRLSGQFVLTADGMRAASERQKTLHNAIDWSYKLLPPEEQKLFAYLSVFSGSFTLEAVEALFSRDVTEKLLPNLLALLLDKSLLKLARDPEDPGMGRYTMLVTIREYARECLQEMGEKLEIHNRHVAYFLKLAENAAKELRGPNQLEWLSRLQSDRDNLCTALDWAIETGQTETALQMARKLDLFWHMRGDHIEGLQWLQRVLDMPQTPLFPEAHAEALAQMAQHIWLQTGEKEARPSAEQALSIARAHHDKHNTARALIVLGQVQIYEGNFAAAEMALEEGKILFHEVGDTWGYAHAMACHALAARYQNDWTTANILNQQTLSLFREVGDRYFQGVSLRDQGIRLVQQGHIKQAIEVFKESLSLAQQLDSKYEIAVVLRRMGEAEQYAGNPARTMVLSWAARNVFDSIGAWQQKLETDFEKRMAACRAALGEEAFNEAVEKGRAMTMEEAIEYALEDQQ